MDPKSLIIQFRWGLADLSMQPYRVVQVLLPIQGCTKTLTITVLLMFTEHAFVLSAIALYLIPARFLVKNLPKLCRRFPNT